MRSLISTQEVIEKQIDFIISLYGGKNIREIKRIIDRVVGSHFLNILEVEDFIPYLSQQSNIQGREPQPIFCIKILQQFSNAGLVDCKRWYDKNKVEIEELAVERSLFV